MMDDDTEAELRKAADELSKLRDEARDRIRESVLDEVSEMEKKGFDPGKGRGRGPWWADGA